MADTHNSMYPSALIHGGMYYVFFTDDRAKGWWIEHAVEAFEFDNWPLKERLETDAVAALPAFALPGGDSVHDQILIERFRVAHDRLIALEHNGPGLAGGYAFPDVHQLGAVMGWLNYLSQTSAEQNWMDW